MSKVLCKRALGRCKGSQGLIPVRLTTLQSIKDYLDCLVDLEVPEGLGIQSAMRVALDDTAYLSESEIDMVVVAAGNI